jgi:hypothetical protein
MIWADIIFRTASIDPLVAEYCPPIMAMRFKERTSLAVGLGALVQIEIRRSPSDRNGRVPSPLQGKGGACRFGCCGDHDPLSARSARPERLTETVDARYRVMVLTIA